MLEPIQGHQHGVSKQISINLGKTYLQISHIRNILLALILARVFIYLSPFISQILGFQRAKPNSEQSTNYSQHRNRIRREQRRTPHSTVQKATRTRTTSCLCSPIGRVPKEQCSHTQRTLYSPPWLLKGLCSDLDLYVCFFFLCFDLFIFFC